MAYRGIRGAPASGDENYLERHNDESVGQLASRVSTLKNVSDPSSRFEKSMITIAIGNDVREQNRLLNDMDSEFNSGRGLLAATMNRLGVVAKAGGHKLLLYLVMFALFVFFITYYLVR